ncbi:MAG: copper amine oxidase N-terminal domain-containing protein [Armatimonadota bacterium]|nr:copper amine oxidase N-terminal domain-containing protein [Armatimonadota bacterium]
MNARRTTSVVLLAAALAVALVGTPSLSQTGVRVFVDGERVTFDQPPVVIGGRVLVPLRGVFERLGATVEWEASTRTVLAVRGGTVVELPVGSRIARVNDRPVTLDVPAMIVGGRTLVPLRFVSEAMGARVEWREATRTVLIWSGGLAAPPGQPPAGAQTLRGVITQVTPAREPGEEPRIRVESGNVAYTIRITAETAITRIETSTNTGGSVGVAALRPGDDAEVTMSGGVATRIRATYTMSTGQIEAIARAGRTLVLRDGRSIRYVPDVVVTINGQVTQRGADALAAGQVVEMRLNPTTREAWEINIVAGAQQVPPTGEMPLEVTRPRPGDTVGNPIEVRGRTAPGATVQISVSWILGIPVGQQTVTAGSGGGFVARVPINVISRGTPYLVTVTATHRDLGHRQVQFTVTVR